VADDQPERAAGVPASGVWNPTLEKWEVCAHDAGGVRQGECLRYRPDGTLFSRSRYVAGLQEGAFTVFHRNGELAREGTFSADRLDGPVTHYAGGPGGEPFRACCVPPNAARMLVRYHAGEFLQELFFDAEGRGLQGDGTPWPARPEAVAPEAAYDEQTTGWIARSAQSERIWNGAGVLCEENDFAAGRRGATRSFDAAGALAEAQALDGEGRRHGDYFRSIPAEAPPHYADVRIRSERGGFAHGRAVGLWTFLSEDGEVLRSADRGTAFASEAVTTSPAFRPEAEGEARGDAAAWWALANQLRVDHRLREALVAAARAAHRSGDAGARLAFQAFRDEIVVPLEPKVAMRLGDQLVQSAEASVADILDGLIGGADAALALRALAAALPGVGPVALELVEVALWLAPERRLTHVTRALLRFQRADVAGMLADAAVLADETPEIAAQLRDYARVVFRPFDFAPAGVTLVPEPALAELPGEIAQSRDSLRWLVGVYVTRLRRLRAAVTALAGRALPAEAPDWLPPELTALAPEDQALRRERITCDPEPGADGPPETVEIDETVVTEGLGAPALLAAAHADYAALAWLCWATGLDQVAVPETVAARPTLTAAMRLVGARYWRARDLVTTGGLVAHARAVPGFEWLGTDIDTLPPMFAEMVAAEYLAVRSMLIWLVTSDTMSPFQDDIRDA
jgi:hypothetical protein